MGGGVSQTLAVPEDIDEAFCRSIAGDYFNKRLFDELADITNAGDGLVTKAEFFDAVSNLTDAYLSFCRSYDDFNDDDERVHVVGEEDDGDWIKVNTVNDSLVEREFTTSFDQHGRSVRTLIDSAQCVLVFLTEEYIERVNDEDVEERCETEFFYAITSKSKAKVIPIVLDAKCRSSDTWGPKVGPALEGLEVIDLTGNLSNQKYLIERVAAIQERISAIVKVTVKQSNFVRSREERAVDNWEDVMDEIRKKRSEALKCRMEMEEEAAVKAKVAEQMVPMRMKQHAQLEAFTKTHREKAWALALAASEKDGGEDEADKIMRAAEKEIQEAAKQMEEKLQKAEENLIAEHRHAKEATARFAENLEKQKALVQSNRAKLKDFEEEELGSLQRRADGALQRSKRQQRIYELKRLSAFYDPICVKGEFMTAKEVKAFKCTMCRRGNTDFGKGTVGATHCYVCDDPHCVCGTRMCIGCFRSSLGESNIICPVCRGACVLTVFKKKQRVAWSPQASLLYKQCCACQVKYASDEPRGYFICANTDCVDDAFCLGCAANLNTVQQGK